MMLAGCVAAGPSSTPAPTGTATNSPSPTPAAAPTPTPLPGNGLFQINAVATASNGAIADLVEIAYLPTAAAAGQTALLDSQFQTLEEPGPDEHPITVQIHGTPDEIVRDLLERLPAEVSFRG